MKKVLAAAVLLALVLIGAVFALPLVVSSDSLRSALAQQLSTASGSKISLAGPIRFSVVPDFGIVADDLAYVSGDGAMSISSERTVASVGWSSLVSDRIRITGVELRNPHITLSSGDGRPTSTAPEPAQETDVFRLAASYLQRLAIDKISISNGEIVESSAAGMRPVASDINLDLSIPGIDEPASLAFSGSVNGMQVKLDGEIGSLRALLNRQPAKISLTSTMSPPPHPALANLGMSGQIQLADDGSYRLKGGEVTSGGQSMRIDAAYVPGDRPYVKAAIKADTLDFSDLESATDTAAVADKGSVSGAPANFSAQRKIDLDFELQAGAVRAGDAIARDFTLQAVLRDGKLKATVGSQEIAGGQLATAIYADFNDDNPEFKGYLNLAAIDIENLARLAGRKVPATGRLSSKLQYAFRGTDASAIRKTINIHGNVGITGGVVEVPELASVAGPRASRITALDAKAEVNDINDPLAVSGTMTWNGENVGFATSIALVDFLSGKPGAVAVNVKSRPVDAKFSGIVGSDGSAKGKAVVQAGSLSGLLRWVGQDPGTPFGRFSYSGTVVVAGKKVALDNARIALDDMEATGSATISTAGKTTIRAALSVNTLDFAKLTGGGADSGKSSSATSPGAIDLSVLRQLDADIRLDATRIGYGDIKAGPATASLTVRDGIARLAAPEAGFYGGKATVNVIANGAGNTPAINLETRLENVAALPFFADAAGFTRIEGTLNGGVAVKGSGANTDDLARSLGGTAQVVFSDGALRGIDVAKLVNNLQSLIKGGYEENAEDRTEFTELSVSFAIENGVAQTEDLKLLGPLVRMDGSGSLDLAARSIDMRLNPRVVGSLDGQGGEFDAAGLGMPVVVRGPLAKPRIYPDITNILANPEQALQTISKLGESVGALKNGVADPKGLLEKTLGTDTGSATENVVTGVIERLTKNGGEKSDTGETPATNTRDLVGSLLQGVLGRDAPLDQAIQSEDPVPQQTETEPEEAGGTAADAGPDQEPTIVLPTEGPILQPNPRRVASAPADQPAKEPEQPKSLTDQAVDQIAPKIAPDGAEDQTADFIKGLIKGLGNQD